MSNLKGQNCPQNQIEGQHNLEVTLHIQQHRLGLHPVEQNSWAENEYLHPPNELNLLFLTH